MIYGPRLSSFLYHSSEVYSKISYFSDGGSKITSIADRTLAVSAMSTEKATQLVADSGLPVPFDKIVLDNLLNARLPDLKTVSDYFEVSISNILLNVICFFIVFLALWLLFAIIISFIKYTFELPKLKNFDWAAAGLIGFLKGIVILYFIFAMIPVISIMVSLPDKIMDIVNASSFTEFFMKNNIITYFISGVIP